MSSTGGHPVSSRFVMPSDGKPSHERQQHRCYPHRKSCGTLFWRSETAAKRQPANKEKQTNASVYNTYRGMCSQQNITQRSLARARAHAHLHGKQAEMDDEETEKIKDMVAPKPSFVPRKMQMGGEGAGAGVAAGATPAAKKAEVVYTPASDSLLEVRKRSRLRPCPPPPPCMWCRVIFVLRVSLCCCCLSKRG